jgi:hypothetical protein
MRLQNKLVEKQKNKVNLPSLRPELYNQDKKIQC